MLRTTITENNREGNNVQNKNEKIYQYIKELKIRKCGENVIISAIAYRFRKTEEQAKNYLIAYELLDD